MWSAYSNRLLAWMVLTRPHSLSVQMDTTKRLLEWLTVSSLCTQSKVSSLFSFSSSLFSHPPQVFFPASPHIHPYMHPGTDPRDCKRDETLAGQKESGCLGAPDRYGHFREPKFVSLKLHWFWMVMWWFAIIM